MAFFVNKRTVHCIVLLICCSYVNRLSSAVIDGKNTEHRKSRDLFDEPRRTFPHNLRRARFYNDLMERDDDDGDDDDDEDDLKRFERDADDERDDADLEDMDLDDDDDDDDIQRYTREAVYNDIVDRAFNDDMTDLGTFLDGMDRVEKERKKFTRDTDPKSTSSPNSKKQSGEHKKEALVDREKAKLDRAAAKAKKVANVKERQKQGEHQLSDMKKELLQKEDFMLMFSKYPEQEIKWKEPRILPECWTQAMLARTRGFFSPSCNMDGTFGPKQCYMERCWCVRPNGKPMEEVDALRFKYHVEGMTLKCENQQPSKNSTSFNKNVTKFLRQFLVPVEKN